MIISYYSNMLKHFDKNLFDKNLFFQKSVFPKLKVSKANFQNMLTLKTKLEIEIVFEAMNQTKKVCE